MSSPPNSKQLTKNVCGSFIFEESDNHQDSDEVMSFDSDYLNCSNEGTSQNVHSEKISVLNMKIAEVNLAFTNYFISELILNTYKALASSNTHTPQQIVAFVKGILSTGQLQHATKMKNRNGECFELLGLGDTLTSKQYYLSPLEQSHLKRIVLLDLKLKTEKLKDKRNIIKETFNNHSHKQMMFDQEDFLRQEKLKKFFELFNSLTEKLDDYAFLLMEIGEMMEELIKLHQQESNQGRNQDMASFSIITSKISCLNLTTRILQEKVKMLLSKSKNRIHYLNTRGKELELSVDILKGSTNNLKTILDRYECKERLSDEFRQLVSVYNKTQREVQYKRNTLSVLNESDKTASFSKI